MTRETTLLLTRRVTLKVGAAVAWALHSSLAPLDAGHFHFTQDSLAPWRW
jgi:hypothetical protein